MILTIITCKENTAYFYMNNNSSFLGGAKTEYFLQGRLCLPCRLVLLYTLGKKKAFSRYEQDYYSYLTMLP